MFRKIDHAARITPTPPTDSTPFKYATIKPGPTNITIDIGLRHGHATRTERRAALIRRTHPATYHAIVHIPNIDAHPLSDLIAFFSSFTPPVKQEGFTTITYNFGAIHD